MALNKSEYLRLLPPEIQGWQAIDDGIIYDRNTLYDYIDGGAELYISYDFVNVFSRQYTKDGQPSVYVEIFDMSLSRNAFGVFSNSKEKINIEIGQGGQYIEGSLMYWKNNFFVSVYSDFENPEAKSVMMALAEHIDSSISTKGEQPDILNALPAENLKNETVVYFIHHAWQNYYYYINDENIFNISSENDAVLAKYDVSGQSITVLLVSYQENSVMLNTYQQLLQIFENQTDTSTGILDLNTGIKGVLKNKKNKLYLVFGKEIDKINSILEHIEKI